MGTFSNWAQFADWALRLVITLAAIGGLVDRMVKRLFNRYFADAISPITDPLIERLDHIEKQIVEVKKEVRNHQHRGFFR